MLGIERGVVEYVITKGGRRGVRRERKGSEMLG